MRVMKLNKIIISAPFGNYLRFKNTTSTIGTFTLNPRGNTWTRLWRVLATVRYNYKTKSWYNKLGLPNPGIYSAPFPTDNIISIYGKDNKEWCILLNTCANLDYKYVELNLSCPSYPTNLKQLENIITLSAFY